ncbi:MAG: hypothetical protein H6Q38_2844 [Chloroflexi bacterium]|nr:hypothetical protein [Chloroflexota bacterium]
MRTKYLSLIMTLVISMFIFQLGFAHSNHLEPSQEFRLQRLQRANPGQLHIES